MAERMVLRYNKPASVLSKEKTWQAGTLPIGNGVLGANVYGEIAQERLTLNEETLWSGGRGSVPHYNGGVCRLKVQNAQVTVNGKTVTVTDGFITLDTVKGERYVLEFLS